MIRLYYMSGSPYSWRVQIALEEKGLDYEPVVLTASEGELRSPEHLARSPHGKVPALEDGAVSLYESSAIVEYLDEAYPGTPLLPADPAERALVRIEELECTEYMARAFFGVAQQAFFRSPEDRDEAALAAAREEVRFELERLEGRAAGRGGEFLCGGALTRADLTWIPFAEIAARAGVDLDPAKTEWLVAWRETMRARPTYQRSYPPHWRG